MLGLISVKMHALICRGRTRHSQVNVSIAGSSISDPIRLYHRGRVTPQVLICSPPAEVLVHPLTDGQLGCTVDREDGQERPAAGVPGSPEVTGGHRHRARPAGQVVTPADLSTRL